MNNIHRYLLATLSAIAMSAGLWAAAAKCYGTNRDGSACKNAATDGLYCSVHTTVKSKCIAMNKDGTSCRNSAVSGGAYCSVHKK